MRSEADAFGVQSDLDPLAFEHFSHGVGDVGVVAGDQAWALFDHGDPGAEATVDLGELEPDVAAADDDQVVGHLVELHHARAGEGVHVADTGHVGDPGASADVQEDPLGLEHPIADDHAVGSVERGVTADELDRVDRVDPLPDALVGSLGDRLHAGLHARHVDHRLAADVEPELGAPACHVDRPGAGHERLGRDAAGVHTRASEQVPLDDRHPPALRRSPGCERRPGLPGPDHHRVVLVRHRTAPSFELVSTLRRLAAVRRRADHWRCDRTRRPGLLTKGDGRSPTDR